MRCRQHTDGISVHFCILCILIWYGAEACNATIMVCKVTFEQKTSMDAGLLSKHLGASLLRIAQQAMQTHAILLHLTGQSCQSPLTIAALATEITGT